MFKNIGISIGESAIAELAKTSTFHNVVVYIGGSVTFEAWERSQQNILSNKESGRGKRPEVRPGGVWKLGAGVGGVRGLEKTAHEAKSFEVTPPMSAATVAEASRGTANACGVGASAIQMALDSQRRFNGILSFKNVACHCAKVPITGTNRLLWMAFSSPRSNAQCMPKKLCKGFRFVVDRVISIGDITNSK